MLVGMQSEKTQPRPPKARRRVDRRANLLWLAALLAFVIVLASDSIDLDAVGVIAAIGCVISIVGYLLNRATQRQLLQAVEHSQQETERAMLSEQRATASQERSRIFYEVASKMSSTLDHTQILETAIFLGSVGLKDPTLDERLIAIAFLFRHSDNMLHIATSQRLTITDMKKTTPGTEGLLARALESGHPVFGSDVKEDPELSFYVGAQKAQSAVAIPLTANYQRYGILVFGSEIADAFDKENADVLATIGAQVTIALQNAVLFQNIEAEKQRIVQAEEQARKKLSRDLHDGPTQSVSAIAMRISAIQGLIRSGDARRAHSELGKVFEMSTKTTKQIRHMLFAMRPLVLENQGFVAALHEMSKKYADTYELTVVIEAAEETDYWLDDSAQGALFYVIEEAVNNARKHAQAEQVTVRTYRQQEYCMLEIEDNGVGFDVDDVNDSYHKRGSLGMVSMRERAELADGELKVQSIVGTGTRIVIRVPLPMEFHQTTTSRKIIAPRRDPHTQHNEFSMDDTRFAPQSVDTALDE